MDNRVYYGQYSLKRWLELILKKNIILPDYQRFFVWDEDRVFELIATFKKKQFVPPITIGAFKDGQGDTVNIILDGQQRLTSILLAHLGLYPDKEAYSSRLEMLAGEQEVDEEEDELALDNILAWNFNFLTKKANNKEQIYHAIDNSEDKGSYKKVNFDISEAFLKNTFLGFSYLVPDSSDCFNNKITTLQYLEA